MKKDSLKDFVLDQLRELRELESRALFGGFGLYAGGKFFAILFQGRLYFRTDATTRPTYVERGMQPFRPNVRQRLNSYYEVPADVIENADELSAWARTAVGTVKQ
jgi:DNA transformation protein